MTRRSSAWRSCAVSEEGWQRRLIAQLSVADEIFQINTTKDEYAPFLRRINPSFVWSWLTGIRTTRAPSHKQASPGAMYNTLHRPEMVVQTSLHCLVRTNG